MSADTVATVRARFVVTVWRQDGTVRRRYFANFDDAKRAQLAIRPRLVSKGDASNVELEEVRA